MAARRSRNDDDIDLGDALEDAYTVYDRLAPFRPAGPPTVAMVQRLPSQAGRKLFYGQKTLLHKCCSLVTYHCTDPFLEVFKAIVELDPEACYIFDSSGHLPLHTLAMHPPSLSSTSPQRRSYRLFLEYTFEQGPMALLQATRDNEKAIPLHLAVESNIVEAQEVDLYLQIFPETIHYKDARGRTALARALLSTPYSCRTVPLVSKLLKIAPVLVSFVQPDTQGMMLLHEFIIKNLHPSRDDDDNDNGEDQHLMFDSPHVLRLLKLLAEASPAVLSVQAGAQRRTPLVMACERNLSISCLFTVLRAWPEQVTKQRHLVFGVGQKDDPDEDDDGDEEDDRNEWNGVWLSTHLLSASLVRWEVDAWLQSTDAYFIASQPDAAGRLALHYAVVTQAKCAVRLVRGLLQLFPAAVRHADTTGGRLPLHYLALSKHKDRDELLELLLEAAKEVESGDDDDDAGGLGAADKEGCLPWMYAELTQFTALYDATMARSDVATVDHTQDLPSEARWDIVQVFAEDDEGDF